MIVRTITFLAVMASVAAGCSLGSAGNHAARPVAPPPRVALYRGAGIEFLYPDAWSHRVSNPGVTGTIADEIVDLATAPMHARCHRVGDTDACGFPIARLKPGGVFVSWTAEYGLTNLSHLPPAGRHVTVVRPGLCGRIGATATVAARIVTLTHATFIVQACLRSPGLAAGERAVRAMIASARGTQSRFARETFNAGLAFSYPDVWSHMRPGAHGGFNSGIVDMSTQPMGVRCRSNGDGDLCGWPLRRLWPGGVLVMWYHDNALVTGPFRMTSGRPLVITRPGVCGAVGGDETFVATVATRRGRRYFVEACLRAPGVAANERAVLAMLASAR
jgi:hypothetical protein